MKRAKVKYLKGLLPGYDVTPGPLSLHRGPENRSRGLAWAIIMRLGFHGIALTDSDFPHSFTRLGNNAGHLGDRDSSPQQGIGHSEHVDI